MTLGIRPYDHGLTDLGNGGYAWLQPDGGWGWSNAGLIVSGDASLVIDTLFDKSLTQTMLDAMRRAEPRATQAFDLLVNTHYMGEMGDFAGVDEPANVVELFGLMAQVHKQRRR